MIRIFLKKEGVIWKGSENENYFLISLVLSNLDITCVVIEIYFFWKSDIIYLIIIQKIKNKNFICIRN